MKFNNGISTLYTVKQNLPKKREKEKKYEIKVSFSTKVFEIF
jgi:hypothetical protein